MSLPARRAIELARKGDGLSDRERAVCARMGLDPAEYRQTRDWKPDHRGLSQQELAVCAATGIEPSEYRKTRDGKPDHDGLSQQERAVCAAMGIEPAEYLRSRDELALLPVGLPQLDRADVPDEGPPRYAQHPNFRSTTSPGPACPAAQAGLQSIWRR